MRPTFALVRHSWRRARPLILPVAALLGLFQVIMVVSARTLHTTGTLSQISAMLPPIVQLVLGPAIVSVMSFAGVALVGYFHFAIVAALVALSIALGTEIASEVEIGFGDLLLARPIGRASLVTRSVVLVVGSSGLVVASMWLGTAVGLNWLVPPGTPGPARHVVVSLGANLWALVVCWGGVAILAAAASRRRSVATATAGLLALMTFLLDYLARFWRPAGRIGWVSPFSYFSGMELLMGREVAMRHIAVLLAVAATVIGAAYLVMRRRDI